MNNFKQKYFLLALIGITLCACKATKFVPEGEYLLDKVSIDSDVTGYKSSELKPYLKQQPNLKMFGLFKTMSWIYNLSGKKDTGLNRFIRKIGEEPVIFDPYLADKTEYELKKFFVNMGYIHAEVFSDTLSRDKKKQITYHIRGNEPYRIRRFTTSIQDSLLHHELYGGPNDEPLQRVAGEAASLRIPLVKDSLLFDRNLLDSERGRLSELLQNRGYYAFSKENIVYDADSALNPYSVDLNLKLRPLNDSVINLSNKKFYYDNVFLYLDYDPLTITHLKEYPKKDSIQTKAYTIYYMGKRPSLKPSVLLNNCFITPGQAYSRMNEDWTYSSFSSLRALNNIHIQFDEKFRNDSALLDVSIVSIPARKQAISFSVEGTNTAGDLGVAASANYMHRNLFHGSETFNFRLRGAYEAMSNFSNPYLEFGGEASIYKPKIVAPFINHSFLRKMRTSTELFLSYNYQTRPEYDRTLLSGGLRYKGQGRQKSAAHHQFDILNVDYVYLPRKDSVFMNKLPANAQYFGYTDQFIVGMSYTYYRSTFETAKQPKDAYSFRFSLESTGNALYGLSVLFDQVKNNRGSYLLLNTPFAQFVKGDIDYTKNMVIDSHNSLAWRIGGGIGIPYGNSQILPFEKRYYSGGANSVRAWSVRELGPGAYVPRASTTFYHQTGDVKLNLNIEYRSHFFWKLEAAAFIDAGNIWTIKDYEGQEGGKFRFDSFYKELAVGYGLGLRLDFDYFLIRFDCGEKAYNPAKQGKERWTILHPNFGENFAWHIAVGYPF